MVTKEVSRPESRSDRRMRSPKSKRRSSRGLAHDVDKYTKQGTASVQEGQLAVALEHFELAYTRALKLGEDFPIRACASNLGAVYIASGQPAKGLEILHQALPPHDQHDQKSNGDLFFNFALGYEALQNPGEAARYLELALEEYQVEKDNYRMEAEITTRMADIYTKSREWLQAARANGIASRAYAMLADYENQVITTCHEAACLFRGNRPDLALQIADDCMLLCHKVQPSESISRVYNELGLTYTQCHDFAKAATCFELALPLSRGATRDKKQEAVILQNLGAVYNSLGDFQRAISFHSKAARQHAEIGNRNAQGQCFTNMAFAYSQLGDTESAGEFYLHALQASRDTGDMHGQWQALEGLGAVAFNEGTFGRAVKHFKSALAVLSGTEKNAAAQERIVAKLTDSIHFMAGSDEQEQQPMGQVDILVNDLPRPPTRDEQRQMEDMRQIRKERRNLGRRDNQFIPVALGMSEYDTDSDVSMNKMSRKSRSRSKRSSRKLDRSSSLSSNHRQEPMSRQSSTGEKLYKNYAHSDDGLSRRTSSVPRDITDGTPHKTHRSFQRPLLRTNSFDSDEERRLVVNQSRDPSSGPKRLHGLKEEQDVEVHGNVYAENDPRSDTQQRADSMVQRSLLQSLSRSDPISLAGGAAVFTTDPVHRPESVLTRSSGGADYTSGQATETETEGRGSVVKASASPQVQAAAPDENSSSELETESETESETEEDEPSVKGAQNTLLPPAPPVPIGSPNSTYLQPASRPSQEETEGENKESEEGEEESSGEPRLPGPNYFAVPFEKDPEDRQIGDFKQIVKKPEVNPDIDGDPIYQTIRSAKSTLQVPDEPLAGPSYESDEVDPPPLPPRPSFETMTRAEKEAFLFEYQRKIDSNVQMREEQNRASDSSNPNLPGKRKDAKSSSKTCVVM